MYYHLLTTNSTQVYAKQQLDCNPKLLESQPLAVFYADEQTNGVGQRRRGWYSPGGYDNIYATIAIPATPHSCLTHVAAISVHQALAELGVAGSIKWINDVMVDNRKICGVLTEIYHSADHCLALIGVGLNVNLPQSELHHISQPATSLLLATGRPWSRLEVLTTVVNQLQFNLHQLKQSGFAKLQAYLNLHLRYHQQSVTINSDNLGTLTGVVNGINTDGRLILQTATQQYLLTNGSILSSSNT